MLSASVNNSHPNFAILATFTTLALVIFKPPLDLGRQILFPGYIVHSLFNTIIFYTNFPEKVSIYQSGLLYILESGQYL